MVTNIFLGYPPENIKKFINEKYGKQEEQDMLTVPLHFVAEEPGAKIKSTGTMLKISYTGKDDWVSYIPNSEIKLENVGDKVYFICDNSTPKDTPLNYKFIINSGKVAAKGNITSLIDDTLQKPDVCDNCYKYLFHDCIDLTEAPLLPATILGNNCY